jgi:protein PhnA
MSATVSACPQCSLEETHVQGTRHVCDTCGYEWSVEITEPSAAEVVVRDANGVALSDGDTVLIVKDLKVKGTSTTLKVGTRIKNIRLRGGDHQVEAGSYMLKPEFLRKA